MKLNNVDLNILSTEDLKRLGLKYQIITQSEANSFDRDRIMKEVRQFIIHKMQKYKSRPRSFSQPNLTTPVTPDPSKLPASNGNISNSSNSNDPFNNIVVSDRNRRMSSPNIKVEKSENDPPKSTAQYERDRRMSMPNTNQEIEAAKKDHEAKQNMFQGNANVLKQSDNKNYDDIG